MWRSTLDAKKHYPWSSASERGIDSLAAWLIPTLGHPEDYSNSVYVLFKKFCLFVKGCCEIIEKMGDAQGAMKNKQIPYLTAYRTHFFSKSFGSKNCTASYTS